MAVVEVVVVVVVGGGEYVSKRGQGRGVGGWREQMTEAVG